MTQATQKNRDDFVTKDMTVGDIIAKYPFATEILMGYGLHCVGCHANTMETLEEGAVGHGMTEEEVTQLISEVNKAIVEEPLRQKEIDNRPLVTLTEAAAKKVRELADRDGKSSWPLKVFVMAGGCSGFKYGMDFVEKPESTDLWVEQHGMKVYVDADSVQFIKGAIIDYLDTLHEAGFKIDNPNATRSCGCGSSFS